jgi:hypothetical protein
MIVLPSYKRLNGITERNNNFSKSKTAERITTMAAIRISDLNLAGSSFFTESESFMTDLSEDELAIQGGATWTITTSSKPCVSVAAAVSAFVVSYVYTRL